MHSGTDLLLAALLSRAFPRGKEAAGLAELLGDGNAESSEASSVAPGEVYELPALWCRHTLASAKQNSFSGTEHYQKKEQERNTIVLHILVPKLLRPQLKTHTGLQGTIFSL